MSVIETHTGRLFDYTWPQHEDIHLDDISRPLAMTCRFGGHVRRFYSVAEHALLVHGLTCEYFERPDLALAALHHDSHEAYVGDIPTPLKLMLGERLNWIVSGIDCAVARWLCIDVDRFNDPIVKAADRLALRVEAYDLKFSHGLSDAWGFDGPPPAEAPWELGLSPEEAESSFVDVHRQELERL